jgi:hypothetical protein
MSSFIVEIGNCFFDFSSTDSNQLISASNYDSDTICKLATGPYNAHAYVLIWLVFLCQYTLMLFTARYLGARSTFIFYFIIKYFAQPAQQEER